MSRSSIVVTRSTGPVTGLLWRRRVSMLCLALPMILGPSAGRAFGTVNLLGQHEEHAQITRAALSGAGWGEKTLAALAGGNGHFGAVGAPDRPGRGLADKAAAHCDEGDYLPIPGYPRTARQAQAALEDCRRWIRQELGLAVIAAGDLAPLVSKPGPVKDLSPASCAFNGHDQDAKCRTLGSLGVALHAAQDFYSHTNWVDEPGGSDRDPSNPPGLGQSGPSDWLLSSGEESPPRGLISGCYEGWPEWLHCRYGNGQRRVQHSVLNKDTGLINLKDPRLTNGTTARGVIDGNFRRAVSAAIGDTRARYFAFEAAVRARYGPTRAKLVLCFLKRDQPAECSNVTEPTPTVDRGVRRFPAKAADRS